MNSLEEINTYINQQIAATEHQLSLIELTKKHGVKSFRFGTSTYLKELFAILQLKKGSTFYDLGSGYGNIILYGAAQFPEVHFVGIEIVTKRNDVCNALIKKLQLKNIETFCQDFFTVDFTNGDVFYLYNPLYESQYVLLLEKLEAVAKQKTIIVIAESKCDVFDAVSWLENYHTIATDIDARKKMKFYKSI